ncbi:MAG: methyltransferase domain-containing protein [Pacificimonas sp.]
MADGKIQAEQAGWPIRPRVTAHVDGRLSRIIADWLSPGPDRRVLLLGRPHGILNGFDGRRYERAAILTTGGPGRWPRRGPLNRGLLGQVDALPFSGAMFDQAVAIHAFEHGDPAAILGELYRALAPTGRLLLVVANRSAPWALFEGQPFARGRAYGSAELMQLVRAAGFHIERQRGLFALPPVPGVSSLDTFLTRVVPRLGAVYILELKKPGGGGFVRPRPAPVRSHVGAPAGAVAARSAP